MLKAFTKAIINGKLVKVGEKIGDVEVREITKEGVKLGYNEEEAILTVKGRKPDEKS